MEEELWRVAVEGSCTGRTGRALGPIGQQVGAEAGAVVVPFRTEICNSAQAAGGGQAAGGTGAARHTLQAAAAVGETSTAGNTAAVESAEVEEAASTKHAVAWGNSGTTRQAERNTGPLCPGFAALCSFVGGSGVLGAPGRCYYGRVEPDWPDCGAAGCTAVSSGSPYKWPAGALGTRASHRSSLELDLKKKYVLRYQTVREIVVGGVWSLYAGRHGQWQKQGR